MDSRQSSRNSCELCGWHKLISSRGCASHTPQEGYICINEDADNEEHCWKSVDEVAIIKLERAKIENKAW